MVHSDKKRNKKDFQKFWNLLLENEVFKWQRIDMLIRDFSGSNNTKIISASLQLCIVKFTSVTFSSKDY